MFIQGQTKDDTNSHQFANWNESFQFPVLKKLQQQQLIIEVPPTLRLQLQQSAKTTFDFNARTHRGGQVRNFNGMVLPSDFIGIGTFPVSEVASVGWRAEPFTMPEAV